MHDSGDEYLSTVLAYDSSCADLVFSPEAVDGDSEEQNLISLDANFSNSSREALDSCENLSEHDCSSSETDNSSLSDNEGNWAYIFKKSIYKVPNLSLDASRTFITQLSFKDKLSRKAQNDLLTLIELHCREGVAIAIPNLTKNF